MGGWEEHPGPGQEARDSQSCWKMVGVTVLEGCLSARYSSGHKVEQQGYGLHHFEGDLKLRVGPGCGVVDLVV